MNSELKKYCYEYPRPSLTADCVIFGFTGKTIKVLLVERGVEPFLGYWALPGGFMKMEETIDEAALRELREETGLSDVYLDQFRVYSRTDRDPRGRVVTVAFIALVRPEQSRILAGDDAAKAMWFEADMLPPLAFDHAEIIGDAREYLKEILRVKPVAFQLLSRKFTIGELQTLYEVINGAQYDRRNFLRTAVDSSVISEVEDDDDIITVSDGCMCGSSAGERTSGRQPKLYMASEPPSGAEEPDRSSRKGSTKGLFDFFFRK